MRGMIQTMTHRLVGAAVAAIAVFLLSPDGGTALAVPLLLALPVGGGLLAVGLWIVAGAVAFGALGWGVVAVLAPAFPPVLGFGIGAALGGGFGAVVRLLVLEDPTDTTETVSLDTGSDDTVPPPEPADLFETHPDPLVYYDATGDGPIARTANSAFADTFGVPATAIESAALADALMFHETDAVVAAAADGDAYDDVHTCDIDGSEVRFRVRVAATTDQSGTRGYVLYTPVEHSV